MMVRRATHKRKGEKKSSLTKAAFFLATKGMLGYTCKFADRLLCSNLGGWRYFFGSRFAKSVAETLHTATHVVD